MDSRTTRAGTPERRNLAPLGRFRRIFRDHGWGTLLLLLVVIGSATLFVSSALWATNERFKREVAEIAYTHDAERLRFVEQRVAERVREDEAKVQAREKESENLLPSNQAHIVVSIAERQMWYLRGNDTLYTAPVAVGSGKTLVMGGKTQRFQTPRGRMTITHKELDPIWVPPDWHYVKTAQEQGLRLINMSNARPDALAGFPEGKVPIRDGAVIIPPWGSPQRRHTGVLGAAKLEMQDGYYFHGTEKEETVGTAASAGCIRMLKEDILWMYRNVPVRTPVYIY
jgi:lipoprotein-anchoring transpeptidase ErfK/SrfK